MDLTALRATALRRYGRETASTDSFFTNATLTDAINQSHRAIAAETGCYESDNLALALVNGTAEYPLDATVIRPKKNSFRLNYNNLGYVAIHSREYPSLLAELGPFEALANALPTAYILRGQSAAEVTQIRFVPTPGAAGTVHYAAWVYPPTLSADGDTPALPLAEHDRILSGVLRRMAEMDRGRGRGDAPVADYAALEAADILALKKLYSQPGFVEVAVSGKGR